MPYDYNCSLPNELWLEIFRFASSSSSRNTSYTPFECGGYDAGMSIKVRRALVQVCRKWRALTTELLYRDVKVSRVGQHGLKSALSDSEHEAYGPLVRHVELPYSSTATTVRSTSCLTSLEILRLCSQLETLTRPRVVPIDPVPFEFDADCAPLPTLKRLEWWYNAEAERSGGINSLVHTLHVAPNVERLFIGNLDTQIGGIDRRPVYLPRLRTLHFRTLSAVPMYQVALHWDLPALSHLILDLPPSMSMQGLRPFWEHHGAKIQSVEFGKNLRFLMTDIVTQCLDGCPNLQEMNYYVFFTAPPRQLAEQDTPGPVYESLTSVGLHFGKNEMLDEECHLWDLIERHFDLLASEQFPNLKTVRLYGDLCIGEWASIDCHSRFAPLEQALKARGIQLAM